jgi:hypothetical protein
MSQILPARPITEQMMSTGRFPKILVAGEIKKPQKATVRSCQSVRRETAVKLLLYLTTRSKAMGVRRGPVALAKAKVQ